MNAEQFNARYPVGTPVFAYPGARPEDFPSARRLVTRTRTAAQLSASGDPVVWVEGEGAYICLTHVDPVSEDVWERARAAEKPTELEAAPAPALLSPEREAEIGTLDLLAMMPDKSAAIISGHLAALLAELAAVRAERDQARETALTEAAAHFDRLADAETDQHGYRARVMRGAANDIRRLGSRETS